MIEKIVIKIGEKEIELTNAEAVALRNDLNGLYGYPYNVPWRWSATQDTSGTYSDSEVKITTTNGGDV